MSETIKKGRLTNEIKRFVTNSVERELNKMLVDVNERAHALGLAILKHDAGEHWDTLLSLPQELVSVTQAVNVSLNGTQHEDLCEKVASAIGKRIHLSYTQTIYLKQIYPGKSHHYRDLSSLNKEHQALFVELIVERKQVETKIESALTELKNLLSSVTTVQRLIEIWPDVKDHLPEKEEKAKMLPAVEISKLKELIPVEVKAA